MKTNSTLIRVVCAILLTAFTGTFQAQAQCNAPSLQYSNAVLVSGTALAKNATYKFPSVTTGVDAFITILDVIGGAKLVSIDDMTYGYNAAWQPVVKTHTSGIAGESYVSFKIEFKKSSDGNNHKFTCFQLSFIDIDGDNSKVREFIAVKDFSTYTRAMNSTLTITSQNGLLKAVGPLTEYTGLDTSAYKTNINFNFNNADKVDEVRVGNKVESGYTVTQRYTCSYFKSISMQNAAPVPVKWLSFNGAAVNQSILLDWATTNEFNHSHFEVERSFNGADFKAVGLVLGALETAGDVNKYKFKDNSPELKGNQVIYYRLKQIDLDGKYSYSSVVMVKLQSTLNQETAMSVGPNPFAEFVSVRFNSNASGVAEVVVKDLQGKLIVNRKSSVVKGFNNLQIPGLAKLTTGMYFVQLIVNQEVIDVQKIVKN